MRPRQVLALLRDAAYSWSEDGAPSMGAAISYYSVFSMAPMLVIVIAVAGFFFGASEVQGALSKQLDSLMGPEAARAVDEMLRNAQEPEIGGLAATASLVVLAITATTVLAELQNALDRIWRVPARAKENSVWLWIRARILTLAIVLSIAFLLIVSLVLSAALAIVAKWWEPFFGEWARAAYAFDMFVSFTVLTLAFGIIYKLLPRAHIRWHDVWIGAGVTALLFALGKFAIGFYLGKSDVASGFGLFGSLALLMIWIYYSAMIFLFGAEFTWVFANRFGSRRRAVTPTVPEEGLLAPVSHKLRAASNDAYAKPPPGARRHTGVALAGAVFTGALLALTRKKAKKGSEQFS